MQKINIDILRSRIQRMTPKTKLFRVLKQELSGLGYWKNRPRGKNIAEIKAERGI